MLPDRRNNFDLLRLAAALQVVHAHASEHLHIAYGAAGRIVNDVLLLFPGVPVFFVISGFLISMSYERSDDIAGYARNRVLRIFPLVGLLAYAGAHRFRRADRVRGTGTFWLCRWPAERRAVST
jgi:peptidoglycan/LPS O-acetylase OafA/YrhL